MTDAAKGVVFGIRTRQEPLRAEYRENPSAALITDRGRTSGGVELDPVHGVVVAGSQDYGARWQFGIHRAVGGDHDQPNPGDILCAALASCLDSTIRMIADRMELPLAHLTVDAAGQVDVRGTLRVDPEVPVGFQRIGCAVRIGAPPPVPPDQLRRLLRAAEQSCVVLQTLRHGVPVSIAIE